LTYERTEALDDVTTYVVTERIVDRFKVVNICNVAPQLVEFSGLG
jgi:hypothetical protein